MRPLERSLRGHRLPASCAAGVACVVLVLSSGSSLAQPIPSEPLPGPAPAPAPAQTPVPTPAEPLPGKNGRVSAGTLQIEARVGLNLASVKSEFEDGFNTSRSALNVGGAVSYAFSPVLSAVVGVGYSQRGFQIEPRIGFEPTTTIELDYFEVPALLRARIALGDSPAHLRVEGGLNVLFLDAARSRQGETSQSIEATTTGHDVAIVFGVGIDYAFGELLGIAGFRYDLGFVDINNEDSPGFNDFNRVGALNVGVAF